MNHHRRQAMHRIAWGAATLAAPALTRAQAARKLTVLVGFAAGGGPDLIARTVAEPLRAAGYTVVVENRPGAAGRLAGDALVAAPADGSTIMIVPGGNLTIHPHIYTQLRYDPLKDFVPLAVACEFQFAFAVSASAPSKTLGEFVAWAKANPGKASYGTPGKGTGMHFLGVMLGREAKIDLQHVPYSNALLNDLIGGNVPSGLLIVPILKKQHKAGRVRILAISGDRRIDSLPDVPTFKESGYPGLTLSETFLFVARSQTPAAVQKDLAQALIAALQSKPVKDVLDSGDFEALTLSQDALAQRLRGEHARWGEVIRSTGYKSED